MAKRKYGSKAALERRREKLKQEEEARLRQVDKGEPRELDPMVEPLREYLLAKPGSVEDYPFGPQVMVFKVGDKIFAFLAWEENPTYVSVKCDPERSVELREQYSGINGAYHLNKKHWHSIAMDGSVDLELTKELIDEGYELIKASLPQKVQDRLQGL
jgi:predicted DNA-binding protein (MmcQ/YjbR family)